MKILLVEDQILFGSGLQQKLQAEYGMDVDYTPDPHEALSRLETSAFDVVIADLLLITVQQEAGARYLHGAKQLDDRFLQTSGLAVLAASQDAKRPTGPGHTEPKRAGRVVLTSAEGERMCHLAFAYQTLKVRCFCAKDLRPRPGETRAEWELVQAIKAAADGRHYESGSVTVQLPEERKESFFDALFAGPSWGRIWQALALGRTSIPGIAATADRSEGLVRREIIQMHENLSRVDPGRGGSERKSGRAGSRTERLITVAQFAGEFRKYFLDKTVQGYAERKFQR
jgi:DNA-binding NarL/FixJ family response regulator